MLMPTLSNFRAITTYQVWGKIQLIMRSQVVAAACEWKETIHSAEKIRSSDSRQSSKSPALIPWIRSLLRSVTREIPRILDA
jgi:hypothetical protein